MTRADAMLSWLEGLTQPVAAFVDYDPDGLIIARALPRLRHIVMPPPDIFEQLLATGLRDRYLAQIPHCQSALNEMQDDLICPVWESIRRAGKALPQEKLIRHKKAVSES